jgi:hypothetical protein
MTPPKIPMMDAPPASVDIDHADTVDICHDPKTGEVVVIVDCSWRLRIGHADRLAFPSPIPIR